MVLFPKRIRVKTHIFSDHLTYHDWLVDEGFRDRVNDIRAKTHSSCPFVWIEISNKGTDNDAIDDTSNDKTGARFLGGRDDTLSWVRREFLYAATVNANDAPNAPHATMVDEGYSGGESGGVATGKEAARIGANVACPDFVKSSPQGTTLGVEGTCINEGCIPKNSIAKADQAETMVHDQASSAASAPPTNGRSAVEASQPGKYYM